MTSSVIGDHVELQRGTTYKSALLDQPGPVLLGLGSIERNGGFRSDKLRTYGGESAEKLLVYPGDIYVSLKDVTQSGDLLGSIARVPSNVEVGRLTQDTVKLIFKTNVDKNYFYWLLRTPQYRQYCRSHATGTTNLGLSRDDFFSFPVPELTDVRTLVTNLLETIEKKIELNHRTTQTLAQIAQALFKSWFVDFDPVRAKVAVREHFEQRAAEHGEPLPALAALEDAQNIAAAATIAGLSFDPADIDRARALLEAKLARMGTEQRAQLLETAALFPTRMMESELGEIPEGWCVKKIGEFIERFKVGKKYSGKTVSDKGSVPVLDQGKSGIIGYHNDSPGVEASLEDPAIVFANHTCYMRLVMFDFSTIQNVLPFKGKDRDIFWTFCATAERQEFVEYKGHWPDFIIKKVVVEDSGLDRKFGEIVGQLFRKCEMNAQQSQTLRQLRDTLLPKLLSSEILLNPEPVAEAS